MDRNKRTGKRARVAERSSHCSGDYRSLERRNLQSLTSDETQQARRDLAISRRKTQVRIRISSSGSMSSCLVLVFDSSRRSLRISVISAFKYFSRLQLTQRSQRYAEIAEKNSNQLTKN